MPAFSPLFEPLQIHTMRVKNRLLMSAMSINFGVDGNGYVTDQLIEYMAARARGGVGMVLVGGGGVHPTGAELPDLPALWEDGCIEGLKDMAAAIKPYDCRLGMQLMHGGRQSYHDHKVAPSAIAAPAVVKGVPKALSQAEIIELVTAFGDAARRCKAAGLDFIEIHAAHGYLINQFLSPNANHRTDGYGGSFDNRIRFMLEVLSDIRIKCGDLFPVGVRINGNDFISGGLTLDDALRLAVILEEQGAGYLNVSAGVYGSRQLTIPSMYVDQGCFVDLAAAVKAKVSIPVVAVGRIKTPAMATEIIHSGKADLIALGRSLLADPQWPAKAKADRANRIRPCIGCCLGCIHAVLQLEPGGCVVNPDVGREYLHEDKPAGDRPKRVLVAGAGPAGLAAARMAALKGHQVMVCDQQSELGGALRLAAQPPGRAELMEVVDYFVRALAELEVDVRLDNSLDEALAEHPPPDVVLLATGSLPDMPMLKGLYQTQMQVCTVTEVLSGKVDTGQRVIVLGGQQAGLVLADHLASLGRTVIVLHRKRHFAEEMSSNDRFYLRERLNRASVTLYKQISIDRFSSHGVQFRVQQQSISVDGFDTVVLADGFASLREAANLLKQHRIDFHFIGDAKKPRHLMYAISEGEEIGRNL